jgi:hypothetical protein
MGQPVRVTRLGHSAADLREQAAQCQDGAVVRRLLGLPSFRMVAASDC